MPHPVVSSFSAFARLLFILYKLITSAVISSFDVLARNKFSKKNEINDYAYNVHSFHLLGELGRALTLVCLKRAKLKILDRKRAGPGLTSNGPSRAKPTQAMIFRPMQVSTLPC